MLRKNRLRKKPDRVKQKNRCQQIDQACDLEKGDIPAMIMSAFIMLFPAAALMLGLLALAARLFVK